MEVLDTPDDGDNSTVYRLISVFPGEYPFVGGFTPACISADTWTMRQYSGFGTAEETNKRYKYLLEQGQTGLSIAFDLPTRSDTTPTTP